ncbi:hypothetical protein F4813DRAFT_388633 [Daldinia decipiens]|uniref:uncharacterized protein n=1 Tax=Daldinia decipiens TaxID=326647 RepID=UPI0020C56374|nr:uncharacterized protein F4813DRAFT_388633 [Daldinia decipiens]KAI1658358.1 hypothetical protein F4813DRAFT_388633 [Daldinia decipiens]
MASFSRDLILEIAQNLDAKSLFKLCETSRENNMLLKTYQRSLSQLRLAEFPVPPPGDVLSSELYLRRPIKHGSFQMLLELENRRSRVKEILTASPHFNIGSPPGLGELTNPQQERLCAFLYRAFAQCDYIADIAANVPCGTPEAQWYGHQFMKWWGGRELEQGFREKDPYTNYPARPAQKEYIRNLSKQDCIMIYYLINMMGSCFVKSREDWILSDPVFDERITVFEECVLRHGSWYAWAHFMGGSEWVSMTIDIASVGMTELHRFEYGNEDAMCSLLSVLVERFNELHESPDNRTKTVQQAAKRLITADIDDSDDRDQDEENQE